MEFIAVPIAAILGWQIGRFGAKELKAIAIIVLGWTTVTTIASVPYVSVEGVLVVLAFRALLIAVPYTIGMLLKRWRSGRR